MNAVNEKLLTFSDFVVHSKQYTRSLGIEKRSWHYPLQILNSKSQIGNREIGSHTPETCWAREITSVSTAR